VSKARSMAQVSAKGVFNIFWGLIVSSIISAISVMVVAGILSEGDYGLVAIALTGPNLIGIFRDWGVDWATIKYTAQYRSENKEAKVKNVLASVVIFEILLGFSLSIFSFFISGFMANALNRPAIVPLIQIASFTIFAEALMKATQASFTGYEKMEYHSVTSIVLSTVKAVLMISLALLGLGTYGAIVGTTVGYLIAGIVSVILMYVTLYKPLRQKEVDKLEIFSTIRTLFRYGLPLSISAIVGGFLTQFYNVLLANYVTDVPIGNYQVALNFASLVTFFVMPILTVLLPAFSKLDSQKERETLGSVFQFSVKYAALIIVPLALMVMVLSQPAVSTIFGDKYSYTPLYLTLYVVTFIYTAFGYLSVDNIIKSQGKTDVNMKLALFTSVIALVLNLVLIPEFGVLGLLAANVVSGIPSLIIALWWIKKKYAATINWGSSAKILLASALAAVVTYLATFQLTLPSLVTLIIGVVIFVAIYLVTTPLVGAITQSDVQTFKHMAVGLGPLAPILILPLSLIERLIKVFQRS
jgi:O-antigen/teichoic acid export membrane protein